MEEEGGEIYGRTGGGVSYGRRGEERVMKEEGV